VPASPCLQIRVLEGRPSRRLTLRGTGPSPRSPGTRAAGRASGNGPAADPAPAS
jgi:hypothetical protein